MPAIKLKPETVKFIDAFFAFAESFIASGAILEGDKEFAKRVQLAKMDWLGYKTFIGM
jgi:hypothetical protein